MITLLSFTFWLHFFVFILGSFVAFYIPGSLILSHLKLRSHHFAVFSVIIGMGLFAWQAYIFGYLGVRNLSYVYLVIVSAIWLIRLKSNKFSFADVFKDFKGYKIDWVLFAISSVGVLVQLIPIFGFGLETSKGIHYCCGNSGDFFFHFALSRSLMDNFPAFQPGMYGVEISNYHYWSNLVVSDFARLFKVSLSFTQFQFTPLMVSLLYAGAVISIGQLLSISKSFIRLLVLFMLLSGDAIFFVLVFLGKGITEYHLMSSLEDATKFWVNPPRAFSLLIILASIYFLIYSLKNRERNLLSFALFCVLGATATGFKVYLGIFHGFGLSLLFITFLLQRKWQYLLFTVLSYIVLFIIFLPANSHSGGLFLAPFNIVRDFISQKPLGLIRLEMARQIFYEDNKFVKALFFDLIYTILFILSIFGVKLLALIQSVRSISLFPVELTVYLLAGSLISFLVGLFFLQSSGGANTFNFILSSWHMISFFSALGVWFIMSKIKIKKLRIIFLAIVVFLLTFRTLDATLLTLRSYFSYEIILTKSEKAFYDKVEKIDKRLMVIDREFNPDRTAPYVYAQTGQRMFLSGEGILRSHNVIDEKRAASARYILESDNPDIALKEMYSNKIEYILMYNNHKIRATESALFLNKTIDEAGIQLYTVDRKTLLRYLKTRKLQ